MTDHATTIRAYWAAAEARDWDTFAALLSPDIVYDVSQTRERVTGREAYLRFNREFPGDWHLRTRRVVAGADGGASWLDFTLGEETMTGLSFFTFDEAGLISSVDDFWPEPYDPPAGRAHLTERY